MDRVGPSGPGRLRQLGADLVDNLAEAAVPGVQVEARSDLRQHVVERLQDLLQTHVTSFCTASSWTS